MIKSRVLTRLFVVSPSKYIIRLLLNLGYRTKSVAVNADGTS